MKKLLTSALLICLLVSAAAQTGWSRRDRQDFRTAQVALAQNDLALAYRLLDPIQPKDTSFAPVNLAFGIACLDWKKDTDKALKLLSSAVRSGLHEALFHYARARHRNMHFTQAIDTYMRYIDVGKRKVDDDEVLRHIEIARRAMAAIANPVDVRITNVGPSINTSAPEYVPVITPDNSTMYFTSRREDSTGGLLDPDGKYFEDVYRSRKIGQEWSTAENIGRPINSETHDATVSISADGSTMIIYRTNQNLTGGDLYLTRLEKGQWSTPEKLPASVNTPYQEASATLSPDKTTLIFSSNRPGGYGGKDLYRVRRLPNGEWSLPKNLGPVINTPFDEDAPHLDVDGRTLYFASKGHTTIGGYDIFRSTLTGRDTWTTPENLGYPVNTVDDDLYLSLDAGGRTGYFSSARPGGFGNQDIYSVEFVYRRAFTVVVGGELIDLNSEPVQATITIIDEGTREVQGVYRSNRLTGKFITVLHPMTSYKLLIEAKGYDSVIDELFIPFPDHGGSDEIELTPYILRKQ